MRDNPCKTCPKCIRQIITNVMGRSCHSELCPYDYLQWKADLAEIKEQTWQAKQGDLMEALVRKDRIDKLSRRKRR